MKSFLAPLALALPLIASAAEPPLVFTSGETVTTSADGGLPSVVGVQNIQVYRANRTRPDHVDGVNHTYSHQPMLAYWHGRFYLEYLSSPVGEHETLGVTSLTSSRDGLTWEKPRVVFPSFKLPDGTETIAHQRMGLHVSKDNRLLALAFAGKHPTPNDGTGIGRTVREVLPNGSFGPIYFIRLNAKQPFPDFKPPYPLYTASPDKGFVAACEEMLADKLVVNQWWEEDQLDESGFYTIKGKAFSYTHRPDGSVLGVWKNALVATSRDEGKTWTDKTFGGNLFNNASKYWLQHTSDNRYALFLNPTGRLRHPLSVMTSDDAAHFSRLLAVHGELPDQRFGGAYKNMGPQYVRGIVEGDGTPPDAKEATWVSYSVNKEDIWVSRVPVPITAEASGPVDDKFEKDEVGTLPRGWNIYTPLWAPVRVVNTPDSGRALELRDDDPYDYARAVRAFPATHGVTISFKIFARQTNARLEIDLQDAKGARPTRIALAEDGHLWACHEGQWFDAGPYTANQWHRFELEIPKDPAADRCAITLDGKSPLKRPAFFTDPVTTVERLSFRTGAYRDRGYGGHDLPGGDNKVAAASFLIDDVTITPAP